MDELLIETLNQIGYPVFLQGSLAPDATYPEHFFTFWNRYTQDVSFYNNKETKTLWEYELNFYSTNREYVRTKLNKAIKLLKEKNFIIDGKGHDVGSDEPTHTGRGINIVFIENIEEE